MGKLAKSAMARESVSESITKGAGGLAPVASSCCLFVPTPKEIAQRNARLFLSLRPSLSPFIALQTRAGTAHRRCYGCDVRGGFGRIIPAGEHPSPSCRAVPGPSDRRGWQPSTARDPLRLLHAKSRRVDF